MTIRTTLKIFIKKGQIQRGSHHLFIIQFISSMYPYYIPYQSSYYVPQYTPYYTDVNQLFQYYSMNQDIKVQELNSKNQQVNTNYSINECHPKPEINKPTPTAPQQSLSFSDDKYDFQNNDQQSAKKITNTNESNNRSNEQKIPQPKFRYTHKNFESNIINKIFSFLWSQDKSKKYVSKILTDKTKVALYFDYIKIIRKYCKRYINKEYLLNLCDYQIEHIAYKIVMKQTQKLKYFSMEQFSMTVRKLIFIYLDTVCATSILTSKKMRTDIWREHFEKMRNIKDFLFGNLSSEEYDVRLTYSYKEIYSHGDHKREIDQ